MKSVQSSRWMLHVTTTLIIALVLTACGEPAVLTDIPPERPINVPAFAIPSSPATEQPTIQPVAYTDGDPDNFPTTSVLLFFAGNTDPFSLQNHERLKLLYASGSAMLPAVRLRFDYTANVRMKYQVFVEDTFILLGSRGQVRATAIHPTEEELRALIRGEIPEPRIE